MLNLRAHAGAHNLAFGNYFAYYTQDNSWMFSDILMDIRDNPRLLDMVVTSPNGEKLNVTLNGFRRFLSTYVNAHGNNTLVAIYGDDDWSVTDRFKLDFGLRYEHQNYFQVAENSSNVDLDGNSRTIYDIETFGNQTFRQFNFDIDDVAYSFGANYQLKPDHLALYGSYTHGIDSFSRSFQWIFCICRGFNSNKLIKRVRFIFCWKLNLDLCGGFISTAACPDVV